jgi:spoIIIJ-associated protein
MTEPNSLAGGAEQFQARLNAFVEFLCHTIGLRIEGEITEVEGMLFLNLQGPDVGELTANHDDLLRAVEYLLNKMFQSEVTQFGMINCDVSGRKQTRMAELRLIARTAAEKVRETKVPYKFNPMDSRERRIIHLSLAQDQGIHTESEGEGEYRKVVIYPAS